MSIDPSGLQSADMDFKDRTVEEKDLATGSLLLADRDHPYKVADEAWLDLVGCTAFMEAQPDATGVGSSDLSEKNYVPWKAMRLNRTAMEATHKMLTAAKEDVKQAPITIDAAYDVVKFGSSYGYDTALMILLSDYESTGVERKPLSAEYREWLSENAAKYGFIKAETEDAYRYVGIPHAEYITEKSIDLASYIEYLKTNTMNEKGLLIKSDNGSEYYVYYAPANNGGSIKIPADSESELSGTNEGGMIVTVKIG